MIPDYTTCFEDAALCLFCFVPGSPACHETSVSEQSIGCRPSMNQLDGHVHIKHYSVHMSTNTYTSCRVALCLLPYRHQRLDRCLVSNRVTNVDQANDKSDLEKTLPAYLSSNTYTSFSWSEARAIIVQEGKKVCYKCSNAQSGQADGMGCISIQYDK